MKEATLLPADIYQVVNKSLLSENDKLILNMLYMPLLGNDSVALYLTLYNELRANSYLSVELNHHHLMTALNISLESIKKARIKLEGIGLLKTYYKSGNINSYVYEIYSPLSASEFFNHPIFNVVLFNYVGKEEYTRLLNYFKIPKLALNDYEDITSKFDMTFSSKSYNLLDFENTEVLSKNKLKLAYELDYDFDLIICSMPKNIINDKAFNKTIKELIVNLGFIYDIDPINMSEIIKTCINEKGLIDKEELRKNTRKFYQYNNNNKLPNLIFKTQPDYVRSSIGDNTRKGRLIKVFEDNSPYEFLKAKNKGDKPTTRDMKLLEDLIVDLKLNPAVVNVLIDYVLRTNNNKLNRAYVETIAGQWKRLNIETAKEAMEIAEKEHNKYKKKYVQTKPTKEEKTPLWFDKKIEKETITEEERKELEEMMKCYK